MCATCLWSHKFRASKPASQPASQQANETASANELVSCVISAGAVNVVVVIVAHFTFFFCFKWFCLLLLLSIGKILIFFEQLYLQRNSSHSISFTYVNTYAFLYIYYIHLYEALYGIIKFGFFRCSLALVRTTSTHRHYHIIYPHH